MRDSTRTVRWYQFSLRTLLLFVTLFAIGCSWLGVKVQQARREREAAAAIEEAGGVVFWSEPSGPPWLRSALGEDLFVHVESVFVLSTESPDAQLENLAALSQLEELTIDGPGLTDAGLGKIRGLHQVRVLSLSNSLITDAGLEHLATLDELRELNISYNLRLTDKGLEHLKGLRHMRALSVNTCGTHITSSGVEELQRALPHCKIWW